MDFSILPSYSSPGEISPAKDAARVDSTQSRWQVKLAFALMWAFVLVTGCEALWGYLTPGDFFANGNPLVQPSYLAAAIAGLVIGFTVRAKTLRAVVLLAVLASLWYWCFVPGDWWVHPPPGRW